MQIFGEAIRFGIHSGPQHTSYEDYRDVWQRCEELGFDWVSDFDHFYPLSGDVTGPQFEGLTLLSAMAAQTERLRAAVLVLGVTYRHPAVVANEAATIDHVSGGRLELGMGAAWFEQEHQAYGIPFPRIGVRMDMLDEACRILRGLWTQDKFTFEGKHFQLKDALCEPKPVQDHLPLVIGGSGERRTLRIVAEHGDIWNTFFGDLDHYRHLVEVLGRHCADVGRDPSDVRQSLTFRAVLADTEAEARQRAEEIYEGPPPERLRNMMVIGTVEQCIEELRPYAELGAGDFLLGSMAPHHDWATIERVANEVAPALKAGVAAS
jgi:F420-dependent oxidoreductase-like protein